MQSQQQQQQRPWQSNQIKLLGKLSPDSLKCSSRVLRVSSGHSLRYLYLTAPSFAYFQLPFFSTGLPAVYLVSVAEQFPASRRQVGITRGHYSSTQERRF